MMQCPAVIRGKTPKDIAITFSNWALRTAASLADRSICFNNLRMTGTIETRHRPSEYPIFGSTAIRPTFVANGSRRLQLPLSPRRQSPLHQLPARGNFRSCVSSIVISFAFSGLILAIIGANLRSFIRSATCNKVSMSSAWKMRAASFGFMAS
jgi:hypothetical protein